MGPLSEVQSYHALVGHDFGRCLVCGGNNFRDIFVVRGGPPIRSYGRTPIQGGPAYRVINGVDCDHIRSSLPRFSAMSFKCKTMFGMTTSTYTHETRLFFGETAGLSRKALGPSLHGKACHLAQTAQAA